MIFDDIGYFKGVGQGLDMANKRRPIISSTFVFLLFIFGFI
jgi:hypothetical protein